jgi:hypothetical protein
MDHCEPRRLEDAGGMESTQECIPGHILGTCQMDQQAVDKKII